MGRGAFEGIGRLFWRSFLEYRATFLEEFFGVPGDFLGELFGIPDDFLNGS